MRNSRNRANKYVLTALETKDCPPHYWRIDNFNKGTYKKCGEVRDFAPLFLRAKIKEPWQFNLG